ncbi:hemolysin III family protein [Roseiconus lacunae]|uniref:Hemolysin III family protein n=1 Tax=Roseiconus lacunae TaxID=2605694 RepID=A0ABT7PJV9_9BACT|nr:hemolysin III family protein [Roseiconus lacunae]MDM4016779.1 hemolysin III family protein [Roseiconus lacunae]WRQ50908.1 hemolysin III family protein [Stieleria sp. HD01]
MVCSINDQVIGLIENDRPHGDAPVRHGEEWANAATHGLAAVGAAILGVLLCREASFVGFGMVLACAAYTASVVGTFSFSTLSHVILRQPLLDTMRAWDQAMIYAMISGTYTPIIYRHAPSWICGPLLVAIWVAAFLGIGTKLLARHRVNNITTAGYLLLGWLPAIPLYRQVPTEVGYGMMLGGVLYSLGVVVLLQDHRLPYLHAVWHLLVMSAALTHFLTIRWYVVG